MKNHRLYPYLASMLLVLISTSLTVSTLHSHNHIQWHHPQNHADTGQCLTVDTTVCPICAHLLTADYPEPADAGTDVRVFAPVSEPAFPVLAAGYLPTLPGRSPPLSA